MENYIAVGTLAFNALESKNPYIRRGTTKNGAPYETLNLSVVESKNNRLYAELFGMKQDIIKTMDVDKNKIDVRYEDRNDPDVVKVVASFRKHVISLGDERKEFITDIDFIDYIVDNIDTFKNGTFRVTGQINKNIYNGNVTDRFQIQNIYQVEDGTKTQLRVTIPALWTKDDVDIADWKSEKKIYINAHVSAYIDKDTGTKYVPRQLVLDASKIDFNTEKHVKLLKFKLNQLGLDYEDGKIINNLKSGKVYQLTVICNYVNGNEEIPFDEKSLTKNQREALELGLKTLDDFKPKGQTFGNRVTIYKIVDFDLRDDASDGAYVSDITVKEFEEDFYEVAQAEKFEEVVKNIAESDEDDDDLFS